MPSDSFHWKDVDDRVVEKFGVSALLKKMQLKYTKHKVWRNGSIIDHGISPVLNLSR
jgi:hypothetical protein